MKKRLGSVLTLILSSIFMLSSCGGDSGGSGGTNNNSTITTSQTTSNTTSSVHQHTYASDWTSDDDKHWHASTCGHDVRSGEDDHIFGNSTIIKEATDELEGVSQKKCIVCGKVKTEVIQATKHSHTYSKEWSKNATNHWHEATCGHDEKSDLNTHSFSTWSVTREATETEKGSKKRTCSTCNYEENEEIPLLSHTHKYATNKWSYDDTTHYHAATCSHDVKIDISLHDYSQSDWKVVSEPTEKTEGLKKRTCATCGYVDEEVIPTLAHTHTYDWNTWSSNSTNHWHPSTCSHDVKESVAVHTFGSWETTTAATETSEGEEKASCTVCGYTQTRVIAKLDHTHTYDTSKWTTDSMNHYHASTCGHDNIDVIEHTFTGWTITKQPTEETEGSKKRSCTVCNYVETDTIAKLSHTHTYSSSWSSDSTSHYHMATCSHTTLKSDAAVHTYGDWTVTKEATETSEGQQERTCSVCLYKETEVIPTKEHEHTYNYNVWESNDTTHYHPSTCGHNVKADGTLHTFKDWTVTKEATTSSTGSKERTCSVCSYKEAQTIAQLDHEHTWSTNYDFDENQHWNYATCCDDLKKNTANHTYGDWEILYTDSTGYVLKGHACTVCGYYKTEQIAAHTHSYKENLWSELLGKTTWFADVSSHYQECEICSIKFNENTHTYKNGTCSVCDYSIVNKEDYVLEFKEGVTTINKDAFTNCTNIVAVILPTSLTYIGANAFKGCTNLKTVTFKDNAINDTSLVIESSAFASCTSLTDVTFSHNITQIGNDAFRYCSGITEITLPKNLITLGHDAFGNTKLKSIVIPENVEKIESSVFSNTELTLETINVNSEKLKYVGKKPFGNIYSTSNGLKYIGNSSNPYIICFGLEDISYSGALNNINANCKVIASYAFDYYNGNFSGITSVTFPVGLKSIGECAFRRNTLLTQLEIPSSVEYIGVSAFADCKGLENVEIKSITASIDNEAFFSCTSLQSVSLTNGVTRLGLGAFRECTSLTDVTIIDDSNNNNSLTIADRVFYQCTALVNVVLPHNTTSIGYETFYYCSSLQYVIFPSTLSTYMSSFSNTDNIDIYVTGSKEETSETLITNLGHVISYYSLSDPADTENSYWHYDDNKKPVKW